MRKLSQMFSPARLKLAKTVLTEPQIALITSHGITVLNGGLFPDLFARHCMRMSSKAYYIAKKKFESRKRGQ